MIYSSWDTECGSLKLVILGHYLPFYPSKNLKIEILEKWKISWRYQHFTRMYQKSKSYDVRFLRYRVRQTERIVKFWKMGKKSWRYYHFTHVYHKWQSNDLWFLRYKVQRTEFFVILDPFWYVYHPNNLKNQTFEKMKKHLEILWFYTCVL